MKGRTFQLLVMFWALAALAVVFRMAGPGASGSGLIQGLEHDPAPRATGDAAEWFHAIRPHCNPLEVASFTAADPAPEGFEGTAYTAACFALAGDIDEARSRLTSLDGDHRWRGAGIVFEQAHPVADRGDDRSAGPIMELVVEFWPNHHMALYHAGAANYALGNGEAAERYLRDFLQYYAIEDGWRSNAGYMFDRVGR